MLAALASTLVLAAAPQAGVVRVPQDAPTLKAAIDRAAPGDEILLDRGTYRGGVTVPPGKPGLTIRGVDRNAVVFDGGGVRRDAIVVRADGVALMSLPRGLQRRTCAGARAQRGDRQVGADPSIPIPVALIRFYTMPGPEPPSYRTMPVPPAQPNQP